MIRSLLHNLVTRTRQTPGRIIAVLALGTILLAGRWIEPSSIPGICIFKWLTGFPCMFCGLTHSFHAISNMEFMEAYAYHHLGFLAYFLILFHFIISILRLGGWHAPRLLPCLSPYTMMIATFILYTLVWIIRILTGDLS